MKRLTGILSTLLLSALIVWMSTGVALWHCAHTGLTTQVAPAMAKDCCKSHCKSRPSYDTASCMSMKVVQLSPSTVAPKAKLSFAGAGPILLFCLLWAPLLLPLFEGWKLRCVPLAWHSPPRARLRQLRVLLI